MHYCVEENYMTILSSFSANIPHIIISSQQLAVSMHETGSLICNGNDKLMVKMITSSLLCMEKQEMEMKWKRKPETGKRNGNTTAQLLSFKCCWFSFLGTPVFLPPVFVFSVPSCSVCVIVQYFSLGSLFIFSAVFYLGCSILSNQLILYKYALYMS